MHDEIKLDTPRLEEMDSFLKYIYEIKKSNPKIMITNSLVYREITRSGLKENDMNIDRSLISNQHFFPKWT